MDTFVYQGECRREISFPIGGIGSGCVGLAGDGRLIDWEIQNRPNKESMNGFSGFVIRTERTGRVADIRALQGPLTASRTGSPDAFGHGAQRSTCAGWPHFASNTFCGDFPIARLDFQDGAFPGQVSLTAFNPFIPLNEYDSSLPVAMYELSLTNNTASQLHYTACMTVCNPVALAPQNRAPRDAALRGIVLGSASEQRDRARWGELCMATDADDADAQLCWYRGKWFDGPAMFWNDLGDGGRLRARSYADEAPSDHATLAAHLCAQPGQVVRVRFALAWYFPNQYAYWHKDAPSEEEATAQWRNYYATQFDGAEAVAAYALLHWNRLYERTRAFRDALYRSTLPRVALEAVAANLSLLKSPTVWRLENGSLYGWEGCNRRSGSCEGSCTHVWNYAYAAPYLFPRLERSMREEDYRHNLDQDGRMGFRLQLPLGSKISPFRACCDGQFGGIIKMYREWKIAGDTAWLRAWWPSMKRALAYAWSEENFDRWDRDRDGVLEGRQHHTLDMELFGPNAWLNGLYLAALKAAAEMAEALGDAQARDMYRSLFARGKAWTDERLFNGEYYFQDIDLADKSILEAFVGTQASMSGDVMDVYWHEERGEIKYQIAQGCAIDQVLGQWHADLIGLGDVLDREQVNCALRSIYRYNFKEHLGEVFNPCRVYGLEDERGALICAYPPGRPKPSIAVPYAEETMHGFEYQAASHMILRGMEAEGLALVAGVRDRYDGEKRNPWNEMECGANYARSMASYALLLAYSGFRYDALRRALAVEPVRFAPGFRSFFSTEGAWGEYAHEGNAFVIQVHEGALALDELRLPGREPICFSPTRTVTPERPCRLAT